MIEINLLPGAQKRKKRKSGAGFSLKLPESLPGIDRMIAFIVVAWIIGPAIAAWLYLGVQGEIDETQVALDQAVADSARFAAIIETQESLRTRQETIAEKLELIQEIDAGRYIWPHILDEVSRALPPYTWLERMAQRSGGPNPVFEVQGRTGSLPAMTRFMDALEASPFLRNIQLVSTQQASIGNNNVVNNFVLTGSYEVPSLEMVETVPLFDDTDLNGEASDGVAGTP